MRWEDAIIKVKDAGKMTPDVFKALNNAEQEAWVRHRQQEIKARSVVAERLAVHRSKE
jgi:hypothetical protein